MKRKLRQGRDAIHYLKNAYCVPTMCQALLRLIALHDMVVPSRNGLLDRSGPTWVLKNSEVMKSL